MDRQGAKNSNKAISHFCEAQLRARARGDHKAQSHIEVLLAPIPAHASLITVTDGHAASLAWLEAVQGHRTRSLGVENFGQTDTIADLYRHCEIDGQAVVEAAHTFSPQKRLRPTVIAGLSGRYRRKQFERQNRSYVQAARLGNNRVI